MKIIVKAIFVIAVFALCSNVSAQNSKLAHINMEELIVAMPEYDSAMVKLQKLGQDLQKGLEEMQVEMNRKQEEFSKNQDKWTDLVKQSKNEELVSIYQRIQTFQQSAEETMQQEQGKAMQPVWEKANKAVEAVAKEQGVTYVISANPQVLIYKAVGTLDLLPAAKKHLGITK